MANHELTPQGVSKDIIASAMDLVGYDSKGWSTLYLLTAGNIALAATVCTIFLPTSLALMATAGVLLMGIGIFGYLAHAQAGYREHTLIVRNALERRLGIPEYARHRESYVAPTAWPWRSDAE